MIIDFLRRHHGAHRMSVEAVVVSSFPTQNEVNRSKQVNRRNKLKITIYLWLEFKKKSFSYLKYLKNPYTIPLLIPTYLPTFLVL